MNRRTVACLLSVLAVLSCVFPVAAQPLGWANVTVADWRRVSEQQQGGMVLGAMNAAAWAGWSCPRPISATMVRSVLTSSGIDGVDPGDHFFPAVLTVMETYFGCTSKDRGTKS